MPQDRRYRFFIDRDVQGPIIAVVSMYWGYCLLSVALMLTIWTMFVDRPSSSLALAQLTWNRGGPALIGSILLLPIVLFDCVRASHRIVGPAVRLRNCMKRLANGETVAPIKLRDGDHWVEFADEFNRLSEQVSRERAELAALAEKTTISV